MAITIALKTLAILFCVLCGCGGKAKQIKSRPMFSALRYKYIQFGENNRLRSGVGIAW